MAKYIRIIYLYVVSFISLGMLVAGIVATVSSITEYYFPTDYVFFREEQTSSYYYSTDDASKGEIDKRNEQRKQIKEIATDVAIVALAIPLYTYHWKKIQKERETEVE